MLVFHRPQHLFSSAVFRLEEERRGYLAGCRLLSEWVEDIGGWLALGGPTKGSSVSSFGLFYDVKDGSFDASSFGSDLWGLDFLFSRAGVNQLG